VSGSRERHAVTREEGRELDLSSYRRMRLIRGFEDEVQALFLQGEIYGTTHLYSGQEAIAVGFASVLAEGDRVACTYRGHGHALAMGVDPEALLAEFTGRVTGVNGGRSGSMNVVAPEHGLIGCYGIVGGSIAAATGAALALKGTGSLAVAYFGDGATNQAYFLECLNFAKVLQLPLVLVCENNGYGEYTPVALSTAGTISGRAEAMEVRATQVDGMDVRAVRDVATAVTERVRAGSGPEFVEAITYRYVGHSRSDPGRYRPPGELDRWRERDPLLVAAGRLRTEHGLSEQDVAGIDGEVESELRAVRAAALAAPFPESVGVPEFKAAPVA
jgi:TPP-dependent pyruvate/acetoin dehydrogenase alpha subunit